MNDEYLQSHLADAQQALCDEAADTESRLVAVLVEAARALLRVQRHTQPQDVEALAAVLRQSPDLRIEIELSRLGGGVIRAVAVGGDGRDTHCLRSISLDPAPRPVTH